MGWADSSGNLWLFGGSDYDSAKTFGILNDLWEFNPTTKQWTWMGGSRTVPNANDCQPGIYGTQGVASANNVPGGRSYAASWTDANGNFWLFGGPGCDSAGTQALLNDLWKFNPSTNQWAWMGGSSKALYTAYGSPGVYGTQGVASAANVPGGRLSPAVGPTAEATSGSLAGKATTPSALAATSTISGSSTPPRMNGLG